MSQYNKTVLTNAGLALAKRANAGQAKFEITRAVTSADDWSNKTIQDLEEATAIPNIMQQGTIMDAEEVESNNSVIGVSLCFTNKDLSTSYQIRVIGLYVKEEGQDKDFLYAVTTAVSPEYMPDFNDKVMYRFNMQMYLVIGKAQAVNVVINDGASVTHGQFDKYKGEVAASVKSLTDSIATKADAKTVNDAISKIDFTPYAKTADVDSKLQGYTNTVALTKLLDVKANSVDVNNQIKASEDKLNKAIAVKDDTSDVDAKIKTVTDLANTKANSADVYTKSAIDTAFSQRDSNITKAQNEVDQLKGRRTVDSADFNSLTDGGTYYISNPAKNAPVSQWGNLFVSNGNGHRVSQVYFPDDGSAPWYRVLDEQSWRDWVQLSTKSDINSLQGTVNGKADKTDVASLQNTVNNIDSTRTPIVAGTSGDDLFAFKTNQIRLYNGNGSSCKNLPPAANTNWFSVQYIFETPNNDGIAIYRSPWNEIWTAGCNRGTYQWFPWVRVANSKDISNLQNQVDSKTSGTIVTAYDIASKTPTKETNKYINRWLVDLGVLAQFADQINQLKGRRQVDAPDFNTLTDSGSYYIINVANGKNFPSEDWGTLVVFNSDDTFFTQIYFANNGYDVFIRRHSWINNTFMWGNWNQIAWKSDINSLQSTINQQNQTIQSLTTRLTNAENEIRYIKDNYVEGKRFPASQEAQAEAWENEKPTRLAMIEK